MIRKLPGYMIITGMVLLYILTGCTPLEQEPAWDSGLETGAVVSSNEQATAVGQRILEEGGNAVDAAIAVSFALNVAEPFGSGIGGGGFMLVLPADGDPAFIDYREKAPAATVPEIYENMRSEEKDYGGIAVAVPGQLRGMQEASRLYGSMEMTDLISPAINLAEKGIAVTPVFSDALGRFLDTIMSCEVLKKTYLVDGFFPYSEGEILKQPLLAKSLTYLSDNGLDSFYDGKMAGDIVSAVQKDGGILTLNDLQSYVKPRVSSPLKGDFGPYNVYTAPLPSAGGIGLLQLLNIWRHYPGEIYADPDAAEISFLASAMEIVFSERELYIGGSSIQGLSLNDLLSEEYFAGKAAEILDREMEAKVTPDQAGSTTNFITADSKGNVVVVTQSINFFFGSGLVVPEWGFLLNNCMNNFNSDPRSPNSPDGGKVPVSSMTPAIFVKDGKPTLAVGTPGARRIVTSVTQVALNYLERDHTLQEAIDSPRFHYKGERLRVDPDFPPEKLGELEELGFDTGILLIGSVTALAWEDNKTPTGHADYRRGGGVFIK